MKIAFLLYPTAKVKVDEDSSFWIMHELQKRGHKVFYFESQHLSLKNGRVEARLTAARLDPKKGYLPSPSIQTPVDLSGFNCIFIRKEPPFDNEYLYALQILETIKHNVFILNDPAGIALWGEKLFGLSFGAHSPKSLVTENIQLARNFAKSLGTKVVIKVLNQKSGVGIYASHFKDQDFPVLLETATQNETQKVLVQEFVPVHRFGDKRIVILNGKILGAFLRRPPANDFRANLSVGGTMHATTLTASDKKIVEAITPKLLAYGLYFVGIDVIGKYLTEVNVTSPAGIPEVNFLYKRHTEKAVADFIERKL